MTDLCVSICVPPGQPARVKALPWTVHWYARWEPKEIQVWLGTDAGELGVIDGERLIREAGAAEGRYQLCVPSVRREAWGDAVRYAQRTIRDDTCRWSLAVMSGELLLPPGVFRMDEILRRYEASRVVLPALTGYRAFWMGHASPKWEDRRLHPSDCYSTDLDDLTAEGFRDERLDRPLLWDRSRVGSMAFDGDGRDDPRAFRGTIRQYPQQANPPLRLVDIAPVFDPSECPRQRAAEPGGPVRLRTE